MSKIALPKPDRENQLRTHLRAAGLPAWEEQYHGIPGRKFAYDFAWPEYMIACEVEGGTWSQGKSGHTSGVGYRNNCSKYNLAQLHGWDVYRFTSDMIESGDALHTICKALAQKRGYADGKENSQHTSASKAQGAIVPTQKEKARHVARSASSQDD